MMMMTHEFCIDLTPDRSINCWVTLVLLYFCFFMFLPYHKTVLVLVLGIDLGHLEVLVLVLGIDLDLMEVLVLVLGIGLLCSNFQIEQVSNRAATMVQCHTATRVFCYYRWVL